MEEYNRLQNHDVDPRHSASPSPWPSFRVVMTPVAPSSTGASTRPDGPIGDSDPVRIIRVRLTNLTIICSQGEDARFMNMQVLLEQSSIFNEVFKDQMDRTREKLSPVAVAAQNCPTKTKRKQRGRQSGPRASGRGKRTCVGSNDERDSDTLTNRPHGGCRRPHLPCLDERP